MGQGIHFLSPHSLDRLAEQGFVVIPDALPAARTAGLLEEWQRRYQSGSHAAAQIGPGEKKQQVESIRSDRIHWLDAADPHPDIAFWFAAVRSLVRDVNEGLYLSINAFECHFACYEAGAFYKTHRDRFRTDNGRRLSLVYFLNHDWQTDDGGELVLYHPADESQVLQSIRPELGTLVLFASERFPHEVRPTRRQRLSLTGWLKSVPAHEAVLQGTYYDHES